MFGSVPSSYGALSPLGHEETQGYEFVRALSDEQRARAVIWHRPPPDFATRLSGRIGERELPDNVFPPEPDYRIENDEREALAYIRSGPRGIGGAGLTAEQLFALVDLVRRFTGRLPPDVAEAEMARLDAAGAENLWFAWARSNGNHVHSVWRVPGGDWGDDLLAAHYGAERHSELAGGPPPCTPPRTEGLRPSVTSQREDAAKNAASPALWPG